MPTRDRPEEIVVTAAMIDAGVFILCEWAEICPRDLLAEKVYRAMRGVEMLALPLEGQEPAGGDTR